MTCTAAETRRLNTLMSASQASLRADKQYIDLLEAESTWAAKYLFSQPNPVAPRRFPMMGLNAPNMGPGQMPTYNDMLPQHYRVMHRASHNKPQTELFGTAPYIALGRGVLSHVDTSSALLQSNYVPERGSRVLMEAPWTRSQYVTVPEELKQLREMRLGQMTRVGPEYMQPHDP